MGAVGRVRPEFNAAQVQTHDSGLGHATANPISRVDFVVGTSVVCSDTTSPYSCTWQVPAKANATYQIHATAYDTAGQAGVSNNVTITTK